MDDPIVSPCPWQRCVKAPMCCCPKWASKSKIQTHHKGLLMPWQPLPISPQEPAPLHMYSYSWTKSCCCFDTPFYKVQWKHTKARVCVGYRVFCFAEQLLVFHVCLCKAHLIFLLPPKEFVISTFGGGTFGKGRGAEMQHLTLEEKLPEDTVYFCKNTLANNKTA